MVPGVFKTVIPFFSARLLRGLICASNPSGNSTNKPVGTATLCKGSKTKGSSKCALISIPEEPPVPYDGKGLEEWLIIRTVIFFIAVKLKHMLQNSLH